MNPAIIFGIVLLLIIIILWALLVKGLLWKLILAIAGWFAIHIWLSTYDWSSSGITIFGSIINWAIVIPSLIVLMAMAHTKEL